MNAHFRQPLPNRRFRRLLPAALASAALASAGFAGPARAEAHHPPRAKPAVSATVSAATTNRAPRVQPRAKS